MDKLLNDFTGTVRRAVDDYDMILDGDRVAVGVSGGKDSMLLLLALSHLRRFYPRHFELEAVTVELGFEGMDFTPVKELCKSWRYLIPVSRQISRRWSSTCARRTIPALSAPRCAAAPSTT